MRKQNKKQEKRRKNKNNRLIFIILSVLFFLVLLLLIINMPLYPYYGLHTRDSEIKFMWVGQNEKALVDETIDFKNPIEVKKNQLIELEPGTYYWKTSKIGTINKFTIDSEVSIIREGDNIKNTGNTKLFIEFFKNMGLTGHAVLDVDESVEQKNATKVIASQFDEQKNKTQEEKNETN